MVWLYDLGLKVYYLAIRLAAVFNTKAALWISGRKNVKATILQQLQPDREVIWVHCSSLGEFEQGRPIIEAIKEQFPQYQVLLTFFSPSGYEIRKEYKLADVVSYLPADSKQNAGWWVQEIPIKLAVFVKYDLWYHYLKTLQDAKIPSVLIAALFRPNQFYFKPYGRFMLEKIKGLSKIYVQETSVKKLLEQQGITQVMTAGDPRVDRVFDIRRKANKYPDIESFIDGRKVLIAGSTWQEDEAVLLPFINQQPNEFKYIIAPHQIHGEKIKSIESKLSTTFFRYSTIKNSQLTDCNVLIIDNIGMLASLYQYADIVYIGGGFKTGLHNTLEPATFGVPILFGPNYQKFIEAETLVRTGGAFSVVNSLELERQILKFKDEETRKNAGTMAAAYIFENKGATEKIMADITFYLRND